LVAHMSVECQGVIGEVLLPAAYFFGCQSPMIAPVGS
jgi:hypothetical protein